MNTPVILRLWFGFNNSQQLKKAANSVSGDDKAIEKNALDWLNHYLASQEIKVDNLFGSMKDGLNLIYALEVCGI